MSDRYLVLDSSCWIAWFDVDDARSDDVDEVTERFGGRIAVPSMVVFEVDRWMRRNRFDEASRTNVLARMSRERAIDIDHGIAIHAGVVADAHGLATADALIAGAAVAHGYALATFDPDFADVPGATVLTS